MTNLFIQQSILRTKLFSELDHDLLNNKIMLIADSIFSTYRNKGKVIIFGNGGSSTQASHLATELAVRYIAGSSRPPIAAINLGSDPSFVTAAANDFSWEDTFTLALKSFANETDTIIAYSTSGTSPNIVRALQWLNSKKTKHFLLTGKSQIANDFSFTNIVSPPVNLSTALAQEFHLFLTHLICEYLEGFNYE